MQPGRDEGFIMQTADATRPDAKFQKTKLLPQPPERTPDVWRDDGKTYAFASFCNMLTVPVGHKGFTKDGRAGTC